MEKVHVIDFGFDDLGLMGMSSIALVEFPAIEQDFLKFKDDKVKMSHLSQERRMLVGPAMIPNQPIYRKDEGTGFEYYARFSAPVIERAAHEFLKKNLQHNVNLEHELPVAGQYVCESWVKWNSQDKSNEMGFDLPIGTWFISMKIDDDNIWSEVLKGTFKGFSIEGMFRRVTEQKINISQIEDQQLINELEMMLKSY